MSTALSNRLFFGGGREGGDTNMADYDWLAQNTDYMDYDWLYETWRTGDQVVETDLCSTTFFMS